MNNWASRYSDTHFERAPSPRSTCARSARPDGLARADVQVHLRHPVAPGGHRQHAGRDQPPRVRPSADQSAHDRHCDNGEEASRRHDQSRAQCIVARDAPQLTARIGLESARWWWMRPVKCSAKRPMSPRACKPSPNRALSSSPQASSARSPGCSLPRTAAPTELKGVPAPVMLYRVVRASGGGRRGGARALTPLVGREEELELLSRRWERARAGKGQLALIVGEPGIGKSRMI